ncbi:MAG: hypothetical protein R6U84_01530 [Candidatus Cloacimonadales bacterium]
MIGKKSSTFKLACCLTKALSQGSVLVKSEKNILDIHHVHTWYAGEKTICFKVPVVWVDLLIWHTQTILENIEQVLKNKYGINHVTIQFQSDKAESCWEIF